MADFNRPSERGSRKRMRSRSPERDPSKHIRKRSPHRHYHHSKSSTTAEGRPNTLPFNSRPLTKHDFTTFRSMFGLYLDIQKGKILEDLDEKEVRGRWKSFIGKWNRGELSEGWYDPSTFEKSLESAGPPITERPASKSATSIKETQRHAEQDDEDSDDSIGPALPGQVARFRGNRMGPSIPNMDDLELKREMEQEDGLTRRDDIRFARKLDRKEQKAALDELVPRAEAGTRERQLEKKKEVNEKMKSFREKSPGAAEVPDAELLGDDGGVEGFKKVKQEFERKKNERELRKEEMLRARAAEREEKLQEYRAKEDKTMAMLKQIAKQNFG